MIHASTVRDIYSFGDWVPVQESLAVMKSADYLLLFGNKGTIQVPGKVYQYIGTGRPVLMTAESSKDPTANVLRSCGNSVVVPNKEESIVEALLKISTGPIALDSSPSVASDYTWPSIADSLARIIESTLETGRARK